MEQVKWWVLSNYTTWWWEIIRTAVFTVIVLGPVAIIALVLWSWITNA